MENSRPWRIPVALTAVSRQGRDSCSLIGRVGDPGGSGREIGLPVPATMRDARPVDVTISRTDVTRDDLVRDTWQMLHETDEHDMPGIPRPDLEAYRTLVRRGNRGYRMYRWNAQVDGAVVGMGGAALDLDDDLDVADIAVKVHPSFRRRGIGTALLETIKAAMRNEGRVHLVSSTDIAVAGGHERPGDGRAFAHAMGATEAQLEIRRRLLMTDAPAVDRWAESAPAGYSMVVWTGAAAEELVADLAILSARLILDAPSGDLPYGPVQPDPAGWRDNEDSRLSIGEHMYSVAALHTESGRLTGLTQISVEPDGTSAFQMITLVAPEHRGHRLGLLMKLANLDQVRAAEPELREIFTGNAAENSYMIAINDQLGFRPHSAQAIYRLDLA